jgi:hypothetical protein
MGIKIKRNKKVNREAVANKLVAAHARAVAIWKNGENTSPCLFRMFRLVIDMMAERDIILSEFKKWDAIDEPRLASCHHEFRGIESYLFKAVTFSEQQKGHLTEEEIYDIINVELQHLYFIARSTTLNGNGPAWFSLPESLVFELINTDLGDVRSEDVELPFDGFGVLIPQGLIELYHPLSGWHRLSTLCVSSGVIRREFDVVGCMKGIKNTKTIVMHFRAEPRMDGSGPGDDKYEAFKFFCVPGRRLIELSSELNSELVGVASEEKIAIVPHENFQKTRVLGDEVHGVASYKALANLSLNIVMYLQASRAGRDGATWTKTQDRATGNPVFEHKGFRPIVVGSSNGSADGAGGTSRKLTHESFTRGHWRRQPYGPGRAKVRPQWIRPYLRGIGLGPEPDDASRLYVVRDGEASS